MNIRQLLDIVNNGMVIIDRNYKVQEWNHWMTIHIGISREDILQKNIFSSFPDLNNQSFLRSLKSVLTFGNTVFFSQKLHNYLFPCRLTGVYASEFTYMQQRCTMAAIHNDNKNTVEEVLITVQDVTESVVMEKHLREMNLIDALTKIYNRRHLDQRLKEEFLRYKRHTRPLSLIMFDLDHFKTVNDTYGHNCVDKILKEISALVITLIRDTDILARYGGEEFCCVLPETKIDRALSVAERIRKTTEETEFFHDGIKVKVTLSLGVAEISPETDIPEKLVRKADEALYRVKKDGRNQVALAV